MISQKKIYATAAIACLALFASCGTDDVDGTALPDGKYPMTFTTQVEGLTATRATTDGSWDGTEEVAIQIGDAVKKYKAASDGALSADDTDHPFYWTNNAMTVSAWYASTYSATKPTSFSVVADQNGDNGSGYQASDFLYVPSQSVTFSKTNAPSLTFKHLPAKVVVNLKAGDGITDIEAQNATVTLVNQNLTSGAIAEDWTVTQVATDNSSITPNVLASAESGYQKSVQALLVPQQMQGQKFIKVTIGTGDAARDYYYTPTQTSDANLQAGNLYTYAITVKKSGLEVALTSSPEWGAGETTSGGREVSTFKVKIPTVAGVTPTIAGATTSAGELYTTNSNTFTITLSVGNGTTGFNVKGGVCDVKRTVEGADYKTTYSNIRSNLELVYSDYVEVGDYYNNDGDWVKYYDVSKCIGIVFKVGEAEGDAASNYDDKLQDGIHGYVVALTDALTYAGEWGVRGTDENDTYLPNVSSGGDTKYNGYAQTKYILDTHSSDLSRYEAFSAIKNYSATAPSGSSGWYLPSIRQLADVWQLYKGAAGNLLYDRLNGISSGNLFQTGNDGTHNNKDNQYRYWTSTEKTSTDAWYVTFDTGGKIDAYAKDEGFDRLCRARAILTF